jgi:hypothetical protein
MSGRAATIDRRMFLALAGAAVAQAAPSTAFCGPAAEPPPGGGGSQQETLYLGARLNNGGYEVAVIDARGRDRLVLPVEARGHSFAIDAPRRRAVAFARSPGKHAVAFNVDGHGEPAPVTCPADRHFFGHGIFTPDGRLMLATENDYEAGRGVTGIYDVEAGCRRVGEFATGGVGPHEVVLMPDGRTLCVANGGILTHPDYDRLKLNLGTMKPSLAYVDIDSGDIVEQVSLMPELHQLSIRHLIVDGSGAVWFGCQYQGERADRPPLVGRHRRGREPELFAGPAETLRAFDNYIGSMAVDASGEIVATSSPRGGLVAFWDAGTGRYLGQRSIADGCGVAPLKERHVIATSGRGAVTDMAPGSARTLVEPAGNKPAWDNHLRAVARR